MHDNDSLIGLGPVISSSITRIVAASHPIDFTIEVHVLWPIVDQRIDAEMEIHKVVYPFNRSALGAGERQLG